MNKTDVISNLKELGLTDHEATIYMTLLRKPVTHAELSLLTDINRTTLYRLVNNLKKRGLVTERVDDMGKFLAAAHPSVLAVEVADQEVRAKRQQQALTQLLPQLEEIREGYAADFAISTYEDIEGFKRMLWHELKTSGECLCIGGASLYDLVPNQRWVEKHRQLTVEADYSVRELANPNMTPAHFTGNQTFLSSHYEERIISRDILPINHLTTIYNDTVAIYNVYEGRRMGLEITSKSYVNSMRSVFELLWQAASSATGS